MSFHSFCSEAHEKQTRELTSNIKDLQKAKEALMREVNELKTQLKMVEESRDGVRRELIEAHRKIREGTRVELKKKPTQPKGLLVKDQPSNVAFCLLVWCQRCTFHVYQT